MLICGHRGAALEAPENTVGGFEYAWELGVRAFELDVRLSRDERCMVMHDAALERTTNGQGALSEHTSEELSRLCANGPFENWPREEPVPTLEAVLERIAEARLILIEVKRQDEAAYPIICEELAKLIDMFSLGRRAVVASFDTAVLHCAHERMPRQPRSLIGKDVADEAAEMGCSWVMAQFSEVDAEAVSRAQARGLSVACWTPNSEADLTRTMAMRPDVVMTDAPSLAFRLAGADSAA